MLHHRSLELSSRLAAEVLAPPILDAGDHRILTPQVPSSEDIAHLIKVYAGFK